MSPKQTKDKESYWDKAMVSFFPPFEYEGSIRPSKIAKTFLRIAEAYATPWRERTLFQKAITTHGICLALDYMISGCMTIYERSFENDWLWPGEKDRCIELLAQMAPPIEDHACAKFEQLRYCTYWWPTRFDRKGRNPLWKPCYDEERCLMCCFIAARVEDEDAAT